MNCAACHKPIPDDEVESAIAVQESMHWLCFHFVFEHIGADQSRRCEDPSCPIDPQDPLL